jgi:NAD+ kinase
MRATEPTRDRALPRRLALALHPRRDIQAALDTVVDWAYAAGIDLVGRDDARLAGTILRRPDAELARECDLVLALGGDGTMLGAMRLAAPHGVPVLGVNLGRLGYLTEVDGRHLPEALDALAQGTFAVEERYALRAEWAGEDGKPRLRVGYNDIVLSRVPGRGQAALGLSVDGQLLVRYASDGVIAATPGGSTGYSFAAGGPLVSPQTRATIVTPDSPHGLFNRAVVLGDGERLGIEVLPSSAPVALEVDGQLLARLERGETIIVSPNETPALVVRLGSAGFAERARRKLGITDPANLADFDLAGHER